MSTGGFDEDTEQVCNSFDNSDTTGNVMEGSIEDVEEAGTGLEEAELTLAVDIRLDEAIVVEGIGLEILETV